MTRELDRRAMLLGLAGMAALVPLAAMAQQAPHLHVLHDPNCGCCKAWVRIMEDSGFTVSTERSFGTALIRHKLDNGIPREMISCHTGEVEGYMIEGHVPPRDVERLLAERPDAVGLAVPGMPFGSPGMGAEDRREAYDVFLIRMNGATEVFSRYEAAS